MAGAAEGLQALATVKYGRGKVKLVAQQQAPKLAARKVRLPKVRKKGSY